MQKRGPGADNGGVRAEGLGDLDGLVAPRPAVGLEHLFPHAQRLGGDLDELIFGDELDGLKGTRRRASSEPEARMLVSFFSRTALTSRSLSRECSPTSMPS